MCRICSRPCLPIIIVDCKFLGSFSTRHLPRMTGGQALVKSLYREGVRVVFGVPGVQLYHAMDALYDEPGIRFISNRHTSSGLTRLHAESESRQPSLSSEARSGHGVRVSGPAPHDPQLNYCGLSLASRSDCRPRAA